MIAGVDGCSKGWFAATRSGARVLRTPAELEAFFDAVEVCAIDVPIGLAHRGSRACDKEARKRLPKRSMCVFSPPIRDVVHLHDHAVANARSRELNGRGLSKQAVAIAPKICEVDEILRRRRDLTERVFEVHPEVSFAIWNGGRPMTVKKSKLEGRDMRRRLVIPHFGQSLFDDALATARGSAKEDDVLDAFAALWSAERIHAGQHVPLGDGGTDAAGLPMRIVY